MRIFTGAPARTPARDLVRALVVSLGIASVGRAGVEVGVGSTPSGTEMRVRLQGGGADAGVQAALVWDARESPRGTANVRAGRGEVVIGGVRAVSLAGWRSSEEVRATTFAGARGGSMARASTRRDGRTGALGSWRRGSLGLGGGMLDSGAALGWVDVALRSWSGELVTTEDEVHVAIRHDARRRRVTVGARVHSSGVDGRVVVRRRFRRGAILATWTAASGESAAGAVFRRARTGASVRARVGPLDVRHAWSVGPSDTSRTTGLGVRSRTGGVETAVRLDRSRSGDRPRTVGSIRVRGEVPDGWSASWSLRVERTPTRTAWSSGVRVSRPLSPRTRLVWSLHRASRGGAWTAFSGGPRGVERAWVAPDTVLLTARLVWRRVDAMWASRSGDEPLGWWGIRWRS